MFPLTDKVKNNFSVLLSEFTMKIDGLYKVYSMKNINPEAKIKKIELEHLEYLKIKPGEEIYIRQLTDSQHKLFNECLKQCLIWKKQMYEVEDLDIDEKLILHSQIELIDYLNKCL